MEWLNNFPQEQNLHYLSPTAAEFETAYLAARQLENRLYSDEVVHLLPYLEPPHAQAEEWSLRQHNCERLLASLSKYKAEQNILDLGCGNGWFTRRIAAASPAQVLGADINATELRQAARLFISDNCRFAYGDIFAEAWPLASFDVIILNSCVQYFPVLKQLLERLQTLLRAGGILHILDSPIYPASAINAARSRTQAYYQSKGVEAMAQHYHHHSWEDLQHFRYQVKYKPKSWSNRIKRKLGQNASPFPWITIRKQALK